MTIQFPNNSWTTSSASSAEGCRDELIQFWLSSPVDLLETLWELKFGKLTIACINDLTPSFSFSPEQVDLRNRIGAFLSENGLSHPLAQNLMLANFLLSPPGLLKINNVSTYFPVWLVEIYNSIYESSSDASHVTSIEHQSEDPIPVSQPPTIPLSQRLSFLHFLLPYPSWFQIESNLIVF